MEILTTKLLLVSECYFGITQQVGSKLSGRKCLSDDALKNHQLPSVSCQSKKYDVPACN